MSEKAPAEREYVRSKDLAVFINKWLAADDEGHSCHLLAETAGCSMRAINKVLRGKPEWQTIFLADRLMIAIGHHVIELETHWRRVRATPPETIRKPAERKEQVAA